MAYNPGTPVPLPTYGGAPGDWKAIMEFKPWEDIDRYQDVTWNPQLLPDLSFLRAIEEETPPPLTIPPPPPPVSWQNPDTGEIITYGGGAGGGTGWADPDTGGIITYPTTGGGTGAVGTTGVTGTTGTTTDQALADAVAAQSLLDAQALSDQQAADALALKQAADAKAAADALLVQENLDAEAAAAAAQAEEDERERLRLKALEDERLEGIRIQKELDDAAKAAEQASVEAMLADLMQRAREQEDARRQKEALERAQAEEATQREIVRQQQLAADVAEQQRQTAIQEALQEAREKEQRDQAAAKKKREREARTAAIDEANQKEMERMIEQARLNAMLEGLMDKSSASMPSPIVPNISLDTAMGLRAPGRTFSEAMNILNQQMGITGTPSYYNVYNPRSRQ